MREFFTVFMVAIALGTDAFSLALGMGMSSSKRSYIFRTSAMVGIFHVFMPLAGFYFGNFLGGLIGKLAVWIGGLILIALGLRMFWSGCDLRPLSFSFQKAGEKSLLSANNIDSWGGLLALSWSVSVDSFGVGLGLGASMIGLSYFVFVLGVVAGLMTAAGLLLGRWIGERVGKWAEAVGGLVLTGIGIKLLF